MYFLFLCITYIVCFFLGYLLSKRCQKSPGPSTTTSEYIKKVNFTQPIFVQFVSSQGWSMDIIIGNDKLSEFYNLVSSHFIGSWYRQLKQLDSFIHPSGLYVIRLMVEKTNETVPTATDEQLLDFFKQCQNRLVQERFRRFTEVGAVAVSPSTKEHDE